MNMPCDGLPDVPALWFRGVGTIVGDLVSPTFGAFFASAQTGGKAETLLAAPSWIFEQESCKLFNVAFGPETELLACADYYAIEFSCY